ncbi:MAG TPA: HAMP domain-containing sensor histidine kinase [Xanthobacteraceae bacterium]|nr:HAMP domain-containing sensor histidine kinase [Xanthobacteraceae bacterium]
MSEEAATRPAPVRPPWFGLSGKLLVLTILFVMIAEVLIYVPSVANYRVMWLKDRLASGYTAALVLDAAPNGVVSDALTKQILDSIGARAVAMKMGTQRQLLAVDDMPPPISDDFDMRDVKTFDSIMDAFKILANNHTRDSVMRVVGPAPMGGDYIELIMDEPPLRKAMLRYSVDILLISLLISCITATLVYLALHYMFVRPMRRITANMMAFRAAPEDPDRIMVPLGRVDEIGTAERELSAMQTDLASMLHQKSRLAALGLAVSKINHDLRNLLASAQLFSDRLAKIPDPGVQRFAPKLMRALERAIAFCQSTLSYGRLQEPPPDRREILLEPLVEEVHETLGLSPNGPVRWISAVERGLMVEADYDQLFRILLNLSRNALQAMEQAMESRATRDPGRDQIRITGRREGAVVVIEVSDTGPGFSAKASAHLFEAFQGSTRPGGTGLGLAIAAELVRAHGGEIRLVEGTIGATLRLTIPDRAVELAAHRGARAHG